jgi:hypothetical protein
MRSDLVYSQSQLQSVSTVAPPVTASMSTFNNNNGSVNGNKDKYNGKCYSIEVSSNTPQNGYTSRQGNPETTPYGHSLASMVPGADKAPIGGMPV